MNTLKLKILFLSLFLVSLLSSCSKNFDNMEGFFIKVRSRPANYVPTDFALQPNIVIMGDGYTSADLVLGGRFELAANNLVKYLFDKDHGVVPFNMEPFCDYFNIFYIYLNSQEQGVGHGSAKNTALRCYYYNNTDIVFDDVNFFGGKKSPNPFDVALQFIPDLNLSNTVLVILVNDSQVGYTTSFRNTAPYDNWISIISGHPNDNDFKRLVMREVGGKAFARLAQEDGIFSNDFKVLIKGMYPLYGFYSNVDLTDNEKEVRWKHLFNPNYSVGIYYAGDGVFRPDNDNIMISNGSLRYDAPSCEAIIKRIYQIHDWDYTPSIFTYYFKTY